MVGIKGVVSVTGRGNNIKGAASACGVTTTLSLGNRDILVVSVSVRYSLARYYALRGSVPNCRNFKAYSLFRAGVSPLSYYFPMVTVCPAVG